MTRRKRHDYICVNHEKDSDGNVIGGNLWRIYWDMDKDWLESFIESEIIDELTEREIRIENIEGYARQSDDQGDYEDCNSNIIYTDSFSVEDYIEEHGMKTLELDDYIFFWRDKR